MAAVAYSVLAERKIAAAIQDRIGPNRVGPAGLLQPVADGVKAFLKEDFTPAHVRKIYFWLAPMIVMIPALLVLAVIPFGSRLGGQKMVIADLNVGILYTFGIVSLGVYGIVLAGYASNSKYPFLGGIRSSAQMISYEIAMGMSVIPVFLIVGDLNLGRVIEHQAQHGWLILYAPLSFIIFVISSFAETNRLPFDLPESEQELVAGYNTEYSSMKFALFFMGEYANMIAASAMMVTLFLGGWTLPFAGLDNPNPASKMIGAGADRDFSGQDRGLDGAFYMGALDVAAISLRSIDGFGLAAISAAGPAQHRGNRALAVGCGHEALKPHDCQTNQVEFLGTPLSPGDCAGLSRHAPPLFQKESDDAVSGGEMDGAGRVSRALPIWSKTRRAAPNAFPASFVNLFARPRPSASRRRGRTARPKRATWKKRPGNLRSTCCAASTAVSARKSARRRRFF